MDLLHSLFILAGANKPEPHRMLASILAAADDCTVPYRLLVSSKLYDQAQRRLQDELVTRSEARAARTEFLKRLGFPYSL